MSLREKLFISICIMVAIASLFVGCAKKVEYVAVEANVSQKMPTEIFNCETLKRPTAKNEADVLEAYTKAWKAYKSCKNALESAKQLNGMI